ncbi:Phosphoribosylformylglycinamidine synthase [Hirschfeldia incana]|nr:Phosphoribosylformylglycinamidine synthase [Hirschfeldia incana]KAJ0257896.1 Phosphoribosylformylglycinamidine synthase [Hirschfeldia incana]
MGCRTILRSVFLSESRRTPGASSCCFFFFSPASVPVHGLFRATKSLSFNSFASVPDRLPRLNCTIDNNDQSEQGPPQEAVLKAISVSKTDGRVGKTTNMIIGGTVADDSAQDWLELDQKVNTYPTDRGFTAIGTGGDDFVHAMVVAVESVIDRQIPEDCVKQTLSSKGKYVSVNIGPIRVVSSEQVQAVYNAMRRDERMKYFL